MAESVAASDRRRAGNGRGLRIAFIGSRHPLSRYSGIETGLEQLLPLLAARGHEVTVFANDLDSHPGQCDELPGVRFVPVGCLPGKHTETLSRSALGLVKILRGGYDVVHFQHQGPGIFSGITRLLDMPTVVSVHGLDWRREKWGAAARQCIRTAERAAVRFSDRIVVCSQTLERYFRDTYGIGTSFIPSGLTVKTPPATEEPLARLGLRPEGYALFAARLVPEKGCHDLIEAWNGLETDKKLVIAGTARYDNAYTRRLRESANPDKVIFTGHLNGETLDAVLANAYLAVLPSYMEGLSVFLLEALGFGRCILVSDIPENLEAIDDLGFSFRVADVRDLRSTLARLLADPATVRGMMRHVSNEIAARYSWEECARRHEDVYLSVGRARPRENLAARQL